MQSEQLSPSSGLARAVILDMDGLILDSEPVYRRACVSAAAALGCSVTDDLYHQLLGRTESDSEAILQNFFAGRLSVPEFRCRWAENFAAELEQGMKTKDGLHDLLAELDRRSVPYAVATSTSRERALRSLQAAGLSTRFSVIVFGDDVVHGKPHPEIFLRTAEALGVRAADCIVLEDSDAG
ncbi:MAG: HAD family phosphatase, partial [Acidobacteriota bacterium]